MKCEEVLGALVQISRGIEFYIELKKLKFNMSIDNTMTYETEYGDAYTIKYIYDHEDDDVYALLIDIIPVFGTNVRHVSEIAYDPEGDFSIEFTNGQEYCTEKVDEWLTEEEFFQSSTIFDFGDTDLQYWKDCVKLMKKIDKDLRKCTQ